MANKISFIYKNRIKKATLGEGNYFADAGLENLRDSDIEQTARSAGVSAADLTIEATFLEPTICRFWGLLNIKNASKNATVEVVASNNIDFSDPLYQETGLPISPLVFNPEDIEDILEDNWFFGELDDEDYANENIDIYRLLDESLGALYWKWIIHDEANFNVIESQNDIEFVASGNKITSSTTDLTKFVVGQTINVTSSAANDGDLLPTSVTANEIIIDGSTTIIDESAGATITLATGYVEIGELMMGPVLEGERNPSYGQAEKINDPTVVNKTQGTKKTYQIKKKYEDKRFVLENLTENGKNALKFMQKNTGKSGQIFVIPEPADIFNEKRKSFLGNLTDMQDLTHSSHNLFSVALSFDQVT